MPFITGNDNNSTITTLDPTKVEAPSLAEGDLGFMDVIGDAFRINNGVNAMSKFVSKDRSPVSDPKFNLMSQLNEDKIAFDDLDQFDYVGNKEDYDRVKKQVDQDYVSRERLNNAGLSGILANVTASLVDPTIFIGGGALINALKVGKSVVKSGAVGASVVGATTYAEEKLIQSTQAGRTEEEVAINSLASLALGGILTAGGTAITNKLASRAGEQVKAQIQAHVALGEPVETLSDFMSRGLHDDTVFLKRKQDSGLLLPENKIGAAIVDGITDITKKYTPALRMMKSESVTARETFLTLADSSFKPALIKEGALPESLEGALKRRRDSHVVDHVMPFNETFSKYKKAGGKLRIDQFREEVGRARILGEIKDPHLKEAADNIDNFYKNWGKELVDNELQPESILDKGTHVNRVYKVNKIKKDRQGFKNSILPEIRVTVRGLKEQINVAKTKEVDPVKIKAMDKELDLLKDPESYANNVANHIIDSITKVNSIGGFEPIKMAGRGPLKKRLVTVSDKAMIDYLETDALFLMDRYVKQVAPTVEFKKRFGNTTDEDILNKIKDDYNILKDANPSKASKLTKEEEQVLKDVSNSLELVRGTYRDYKGSPDDFTRRAATGLMSYNYITGLGGVVVSSIPDVGTQVLRRGFLNLTKDSIKPFIKNLIVNGKKMTLTEARSYGQAIEYQSSSVMQSLYSIGDPMALGTPFERAIGTLAHKSSNIFGINQWNDLLQSVAVTGTRFRMVNNINDFASKGRLNKVEEEFMNFIGIGASDRTAMKGLIDVHGTKDINGQVIPNVDKWDNAELRNKFIAAVGKEVDRTVIMKGATDVPSYANTVLGKMIFQWQAFTFSFMNKVLISSMQGGDKAVVSGFASMLSLGMMSYFLKEKIAGREPSEDPAVWIASGLDRSGITGITMFGNSTLSQLGLNIRDLYTEDSKQRSGNVSDLVGSVMGPSGRTITNGGRLINSLIKDMKDPRFKWTQKDIERMRAMTPFQNTFYLKNLIDQVENNVKQEFPKDRR